jgi:hypothetical protein
MSIQAQIPPALAATHNFIRIHDEMEIFDFGDILDDVPSIDNYGALSDGPACQSERTRAKNERDAIAQAMWDDYKVYMDKHYMDVDNSNEN